MVGAVEHDAEYPWIRATKAVRRFAHGASIEIRRG
jgi:hypothetical protein